MESFSGRLGTDCSFPELIRRVYLGRWSGELLIQREDQKKKIYLDNGSISYCATNINSERLGSVLLHRGVIDAETLRAALTGKGSLRLGQKLVADGVISEADLRESLIQSARENVYGMFNWSDGRFEFGPARTALPDDLRFQLPTSDVILEGVRRIEVFDVVEQGLGSLKGPLAIAENAPEASQTDSLTPTEGFLLSRIDGTLSIEEICAISAVDREQTCRCLYGMYCAGLIRGEAPATDDDFISRFAGPPEAADTADPPPVDASEPPLAPTAVGRSDIERKYAICCAAQVDHYTVLEISNSASEEQIRKAYYHLAKQYHPDRHRGKGGKELELKFESLFMKISEAYDTLHDSNKRFDYDQAILKNPAISSAGVLSEQASPDQVARTHFKEGMRFYLEKDFWNAVQLFRRAIEASPEDNSEHYRYLALSLSQNPKWGKEAERYFLKAIDLEPFSPDLRLLLGRLYRQSGMNRRAESQFEEALKLEPGNVAIQSELDDLRGAGGETGGSFLKGLFRKSRKES